MKGELTGPQIELLREIADEPASVAFSYQPAKMLVAKGLATWVSGVWSDHLHITDLGRAALSRGDQS